VEPSRPCWRARPSSRRLPSRLPGGLRGADLLRVTPLELAEQIGRLSNSFVRRTNTSSGIRVASVPSPLYRLSRSSDRFRLKWSTCAAVCAGRREVWVRRVGLGIGGSASSFQEVVRLQRESETSVLLQARTPGAVLIRGGASCRRARLDLTAFYEAMGASSYLVFTATGRPAGITDRDLSPAGGAFTGRALPSWAGDRSRRARGGVRVTAHLVAEPRRGEAGCWPVDLSEYCRHASRPTDRGPVSRPATAPPSRPEDAGSDVRIARAASCQARSLCGRAKSCAPSMPRCCRGRRHISGVHVPAPPLFSCFC